MSISLHRNREKIMKNKSREGRKEKFFKFNENTLQNIQNTARMITSFKNI